MVRTGIGSDTHRLVTGRKLILGGIEIDHSHGLLGHSDADVLAHAVTDALLGAAGLGDIGEHFPDTDPAYAGADSCQLLKQVVDELTERGLSIGNVDTIIVAERPKLKAFKPMIRQNLAKVLGIDVGCVNIKAKTAEGLGPEGTGQSISAWAVATIVDKSDKK